MKQFLLLFIFFIALSSCVIFLLSCKKQETDPVDCYICRTTVDNTLKVSTNYCDLTRDQISQIEKQGTFTSTIEHVLVGYEKVTVITQYYLEKATYKGVYYATAWCTKEVWDAHPEIHQYWTGSTISETTNVPIYKNISSNTSTRCSLK